VSKKTVIVQVMPVWAREDVLAALSGLPSNVIRRLYNEGVIRARKMDATKEKSAVIFRVQDALDWIDESADRPRNYVIAGASNG
jgi:hypothetical protein